jgi:hypothetical protein
MSEDVPTWGSTEKDPVPVVIITAEQLKLMSGFKTARAVVEWCKRNGIAYLRNKSGWPVTISDELNRALQAQADKLAKLRACRLENKRVREHSAIRELSMARQGAYYGARDVSAPAVQP